MDSSANLAFINSAFINFAFVWPLAALLLPLPWLLVRWFNTAATKTDAALKLPVVELPLNHPLPLSEPKFLIKLKGLTKLSWRSWLWCLLILALMRPEWRQAEIEVTYQSRQILLLVDISGSMNTLLQDRTRLDQVKQVVRNFIEQRPKDHLGLLVFGGQAYLYVPLTLDHALLIQQLQALQAGMAGSGTAIGDALGLGVYNLRQTKGKPAMVLLTDGANNAGQLSTQEALVMTAAAAIPTHLITVDLALDPKLAEGILTTGGEVFSAYSSQELAEVYQRIHQLEPQTQVRYLRPSISLAFIPLLAALLLAASQAFLSKPCFFKRQWSFKRRSSRE